jgi:hypothetical protein
VRSVLPTCAASCATFPPCARRVDHLIEAAREGAERYDGDEVAEVVAFLEWLARDILHLPGRPRLRAARRGPAGRPRLRPRLLDDETR